MTQIPASEGSPGTAAEERAALFERHRPLLFSIAYRMLGSVVEAEDTVQEAFLRFSTAAPGDVASPKAYLSTIVTRLCLDQLKSARRTRETYIGPWLPEPLVTGAAGGARTPGDVVEDHESISMAFLVLLEQLTPVERAVFLLHEVFDYSYAEIARIVGRSEAACRQVLHRAKEHVRAHRPRFESTPEQQERLVAAFLRACEAGDVQGMLALLAEDVTFWSDGGGKRAAALNPIKGADRVVRLFAGLMRRGEFSGDVRFEAAEVNGKPGALVFFDGRLEMAAAVETHAGRIQEVRAVLNPEKLAALRRTGDG